MLIKSIQELNQRIVELENNLNISGYNYAFIYENIFHFNQNKISFYNFTHNKSKNGGFGGFLILTTYPLVLLFRGFFYINLDVVCLVRFVNVLFYIFLWVIGSF